VAAVPVGPRDPGAVAGLVRRDVETTAEATRHLVFEVDLDEVRVADAAAFRGPRLARAVLDLAAADAAAGVPLGELTRAWPRSPVRTPGCAAGCSPPT
jgi:hypothetical protein